MRLRRPVLVNPEVHVADDLLEPRRRDSRPLNLEGGYVAEIAVPINPCQRCDFLEGDFAERQIEALV